jgi:hypothetical protein
MRVDIKSGDVKAGEDFIYKGVKWKRCLCSGPLASKLGEDTFIAVRLDNNMAREWVLDATVTVEATVSNVIDDSLLKTCVSQYRNSQFAGKFYQHNTNKKIIVRRGTAVSDADERVQLVVYNPVGLKHDADGQPLFTVHTGRPRVMRTEKFNNEYSKVEE